MRLPIVGDGRRAAVVKALKKGDVSIRKIADRFKIAPNSVRRINRDNVAEAGRSITSRIGTRRP